MRRSARIAQKNHSVQINVEEELVKKVLKQTYLPFKSLKYTEDADGDIIMSCAQCEKLITTCMCKSNK
jgi:hypothetical protein